MSPLSKLWIDPVAADPQTVVTPPEVRLGMRNAGSRPRAVNAEFRGLLYRYCLISNCNTCNYNLARGLLGPYLWQRCWVMADPISCVLWIFIGFCDTQKNLESM